MLTICDTIKFSRAISRVSLVLKTNVSEISRRGSSPERMLQHSFAVNVSSLFCVCDTSNIRILTLCEQFISPDIAAFCDKVSLLISTTTGWYELHVGSNDASKAFVNKVHAHCALNVKHLD